jgi:DNA-binding MarR family transcriptional regulator
MAQQYCALANLCYAAIMLGGSTPEAIAARFTGVAQLWVVEAPGERAERARRQLLSAIGSREPATLNDVAKAVDRGAPAVSRAVDNLVRTGLVARTQDPDNRRRIALRLTDAGRERLESRLTRNSNLQRKLERLAQSELRAVERAIEILERGF